MPPGAPRRGSTSYGPARRDGCPSGMSILTQCSGDWHPWAHTECQTCRLPLAAQAGGWAQAGDLTHRVFCDTFGSYVLV